MRDSYLKDFKKNAEGVFELKGLSPRQKTERIILWLKAKTWDYNFMGFLWGHPLMYLMSENCELTDEDKKFVLYCAFCDNRCGNTHFGVSWNTPEEERKFVVNALKRWGILDALKLYAKDPDAGLKWFESHKMPIEYVYAIRYNTDIFHEIAGDKYKEVSAVFESLGKRLKPRTPTGYLHDEEYNQYKPAFEQAVKLIKSGNYDVSKYDLIKMVGVERLYGPEVCYGTEVENICLALKDQAGKLKNKEEAIQFLKLITELNWVIDDINYVLFKEDSDCAKQILKHFGVSEKETNLRNFNLKNSKDLARAKELYPLVMQYPQLFSMWFVGVSILDTIVYGDDAYISCGFRPEHLGYTYKLEERRKKFCAKLAGKGKVGQAAASAIDKVCTAIPNFEHAISDIRYPSKLYQKER